MTTEQKLDEFKLSDSRPEAERGMPCDHSKWTFEKNGRVCPCGAWMVDFGD